MTIQFDSGYSDATETLRQAAQAELEETGDSTIEDQGWRGDWTEALLNGLTTGQLRRLGLGSKRALADYQRGALAAVADYFAEDES